MSDLLKQTKSMDFADWFLERVLLWPFMAAKRKHWTLKLCLVVVQFLWMIPMLPVMLPVLFIALSAETWRDLDED